MAKRVCTKTLKGYYSKITSMVISPDGCWLASLSGRSVKVWDVVKGECIATLEDRNVFTELIAISSDGNCLASYHQSSVKFCSVKFWDVATGVCVQKIHSEPNDEVVSNSHHPKWLALQDPNGEIRILDLATGICTQRLKGDHVGEVSIAISPNGHWLASGSLEGTVKIWDIEMEANIQTRQTTGDPSNYVGSFAISSDGNVLALRGDDDTIRVRNVATGATIQTIPDHGIDITSIAISPNSRWVAAGSAEGIITIWDMNIEANMQTLKSYSYARGPSSLIKIWDVKKVVKIRKSDDGQFSIDAIAISSDGNMLVFPLDYGVSTWDTATGAMLRRFANNDNHDNHDIKSIAISYDGRWLALGSRCGTVSIWNLATSICVQRLLGQHPFNRLAFTFDQCLCTDIGTINLDLNTLDTPVSKASEPPTEDLECRLREYGIDISKEWIMWNGRKLLYMPFEYRLACSIVMDRTIMGFTEYSLLQYGLLQFKFSADKPVA